MLIFYHSFPSVSMLERADSWSRKTQRDALNRQQNHIFVVPAARSGCCHSSQVIWTTLETRLCWELGLFILPWILLGNQHSFDFFFFVVVVLFACYTRLKLWWSLILHIFTQLCFNNFLSKGVWGVLCEIENIICLFTFLFRFTRVIKSMIK